MTIEQARLALVNATDSYGHGSIQFRAALRMYNAAVRAQKLALAKAAKLVAVAS